MHPFCTKECEKAQGRVRALKKKRLRLLRSPLQTKFVSYALLWFFAELQTYRQKEGLQIGVGKVWKGRRGGYSQRGRSPQALLFLERALVLRSGLSRVLWCLKKVDTNYQNCGLFRCDAFGFWDDCVQKGVMRHWMGANHHNEVFWK